MPTTWNIARRIFDRVQVGPQLPALTVDGETLTYGELWTVAARLSTQHLGIASGSAAPVTALMADRHVSSYVAILACLIRGHTYVPVNVEHPDRRNLTVLRKSGARTVICGGNAAETLSRMLAGAPDLALDIVACPECKSVDPATAALPPPAPEVPLDRRAYILFTSGSTGEPKGVPISHGALTSYLESASRLMPMRPGDRHSQTFELTFDLSIHDMLLCWTSGAHLIVPTRSELARPAHYIRQHAITHWFSVPSLAYQMRLQGDLAPGVFPSLRSSLFCGEALPALLADEWCIAAPNSVVENWYGPTEATIACARFVVRPTAPGVTPTHDLTPIGEAFDDMVLSIHAEDLSLVPDGTPGELLLSGPQLSEGYLDDPERNARAFVRLPGRSGVCYRTGDRVVRDPGGPIRFLGRIDNQVKVRGFRIELGEIEAVLRRAAGGVNAIAMSWPPDEPSGRFVVAALETTGVDAAVILAAAAQALPEYMVPAQIVCLPAFPTNASGKVDRKEVARRTADLLRNATARVDLSGLSPQARRLMEAVLTVAPTLACDRILEAETLMAAGMDSLSFISLTAEIERLYGRTLGQEEVVELSLLSFDAMLAKLENRGTKRSLKAWISNLFRLRPTTAAVNRRTNRALQFISRFPGALADVRSPLVLAIGSSGTFRALAPADFEDEAQRLGRQVACFNIGLAGIGVASLARLAEWVAGTCEAARARPSVVLYELDPAQISVLPGRGDTVLPESFFAGTVAPYPDGRLPAEFGWSPAARGAWVHDLADSTAKRRPNWERERDTEVARIFAGDVEFVPAALDTWVTGARSLQRVAERTLVFVHPANRAMMSELPERFRGARFEAILQQVAGLGGLELIPPDAFDLDEGDFLDINHVNPGSGRPRLSRQLARWIFGQAG